GQRGLATGDDEPRRRGGAQARGGGPWPSRDYGAVRSPGGGKEEVAMNPRERTLALAILVAVTLAGGAFLFHQLYFVPLREYEEQIAAAQKENDLKEQRREKVLAQRPQLKEWRELSLPGDVARSQREYAD